MRWVFEIELDPIAITRERAKPDHDGPPARVSDADRCESIAEMFGELCTRWEKRATEARRRDEAQSTLDATNERAYLIKAGKLFVVESWHTPASCDPFTKVVSFAGDKCLSCYRPVTDVHSAGCIVGKFSKDVIVRDAQQRSGT